MSLELVRCPFNYMYPDMGEAVVMTEDTLGSPHSPSEGKASAVAVAAVEGTASAEMVRGSQSITISCMNV